MLLAVGNPKIQEIFRKKEGRAAAFGFLRRVLYQLADILDPV